jgi:hypothetical protein
VPPWLERQQERRVEQEEVRPVKAVKTIPRKCSKRSCNSSRKAKVKLLISPCRPYWNRDCICGNGGCELGSRLVPAAFALILFSK